VLKKIPVSQLTVGMHLKSFCGSWMDHPFWRTAFVITDPKDIEAAQQSKITEVWIDVSKGLDITTLPPESEQVPVASAPVARDEPGLSRNSESAVKVPVKHSEARSTEATSAAVEIERATRICKDAQQAVVAMFEEVRMGKSVDVGGARQLVDEITDSVTRNPGAIISLARLKSVDDYTYMHSVAVCALMVSLAKQLGFDAQQIQIAGLAGMFHDMGKALVPLKILNKPGQLTIEEFATMRRHPEDGNAILTSGSYLDPIVLDVCLHHHEKSDGSGYSKGLKGEQISLHAKMAAVCDVYDAITSNRPYKSGWDPAESLRKMASWANGHFDQTVFQAFVKSLGIYPVGSLVRLKSGRLGVVVEQSRASLTTPTVRVFYSTNASMRIEPELIDLARNNGQESIVGREDPALWKFPDLDALWSGLSAPSW